MNTQVPQTQTNTASVTSPGTSTSITKTATVAATPAKAVEATVPGSPPGQPTAAEAGATPTVADAPWPGQGGEAQPTASTPATEAAQPEQSSAPAHGRPKRTVSELLGLPPSERELQGGDDVIAEDTVLLAYQLVLWGGRQEVLRVKSQLELQLALAEENLAQTDLSFPELFDRIVTRPLVTKFRSFLQRRFDAASEAKDKEKAAAAGASPQTVNPGLKLTDLTKPVNSKLAVMPKIDMRPENPKPPGFQASIPGKTQV